MVAVHTLSSSRPAHPVVLLVDGSSYLYRAYYAMPDLRAIPGDPASPPTGAICGMIQMLLRLRKDVPCTHAVCIFDAPGPTFRDAIYPAYKAQRSPMPEALREQIDPIHEVVELLGWKVLQVPGVEADDVIGTLAAAAQGRGACEGHDGQAKPVEREGRDVLISSWDKDLAQLVDEHVTIVDTLQGKRRDIAGVTAEFGVPPQQMRDYQVLVGDAVDNVPGVPKVGPKTAVKWLREYGSLEGILDNAHAIPGAVGQNLRESLGWIPTARELVTIRTDCDLREWIPGFPDLGVLAVSPVRIPELADFARRYGVRTVLRDLLAPSPARRGTMGAGSGAGMGTSRERDLFDDAPPAGNAASAGANPQPTQEPSPASTPGTPDAPNAPDNRYETILDWATFDAWMERIAAADLVAVDTETTSLDAMSARLVGISFATAPGHAAYIPLAHQHPDTPAQLPIDTVLQRLRGWLEDPTRPKLGQHTKYDWHVFANHGIAVQGYVHDTMLQSYVLEVHEPHNLESLARRHLDKVGISYQELCGKGASQIGFDQVELTRAAQYSCEDSDLTWGVHAVLWPRIRDDERLRGIYELEIASSEALCRIERNGVCIDAALLGRQSVELGERIASLERQAHEQAGQVFNLQSPKQIAEIFFVRLGLPVVKKTPTGTPSTDDEVLHKLAQDYPLPATILEHRSLSKLKGTYTDKLPTLVRADTGRVHTHYAQAVTATGRLSSIEPNLQNIPVRTPEGRRIREAFIAPPGCAIASADYSQIELRIMAHLSGDAALLLAFHDGMDVHRATAAEIFGIGTAQVTPEQRRCAKVINFGLIYGMGAFGLAKSLGIDQTAARNYIDRYFDRYPGVRAYMDHTRELARRQGYVETVFGRRLYLPEIHAPQAARRAAAERAAINAPMQGTAADLIKRSMIAVQRDIDAQRLGTKIVMQVHDELVFEVHDAEVAWVRTEVPRLMAAVAQLQVPLLAEVGVGRNWEEAH
ncbi:DNA polymerase I [Candidatus Symbiobacter mobilis]|uniref:DNA polymerase I n=1 Tax=Candidatus Symbiobacter mobilis CR TaxID=946483 RepID=U5N8L7_9BURK|nr:DNA polymerase I [Candidatus Symbiobacter mobilis]AGX87747.1 DNA polymerase I [Candidatus Symbiobacter mobilis CR]